jgi:hypothetical protein
LTEVRPPTLLASAKTDVFHHCRAAAAKVMPGATVADLPDAPASGAGEFLRFVGGLG